MEVGEEALLGRQEPPLIPVLESQGVAAQPAVAAQEELDLRVEPPDAVDAQPAEEEVTAEVAPEDVGLALEAYVLAAAGAPPACGTETAEDEQALPRNPSPVEARAEDRLPSVGTQLGGAPAQPHLQSEA